jgi:hypothetical protein
MKTKTSAKSSMPAKHVPLRMLRRGQIVMVGWGDAPAQKAMVVYAKREPGWGTEVAIVPCANRRSRLLRGVDLVDVEQIIKIVRQVPEFE